MTASVRVRAHTRRLPGQRLDVAGRLRDALTAVDARNAVAAAPAGSPERAEALRDLASTLLRMELWEPGDAEKVLASVVAEADEGALAALVRVLERRGRR